MDLRESPRYFFFTFFLEVGKAIVGKISIVFFAHFFPWEFVGRRPVVCLNKKCDLCPLPSPLSPLLATAEEGKKENGDVEKLFSPSALRQKRWCIASFEKSTKYTQRVQKEYPKFSA